jgi:hypothetical protein
MFGLTAFLGELKHDLINRAVAWAIIVAAGFLGLVALFYLVSAGRDWLAESVGLVQANLITAGGFLVVGVLAYFVARSQRKSVTDEITSHGYALAARAGADVRRALPAPLPHLPSMKGHWKPALPVALLASGAAYTLSRMWGAHPRSDEVEILPPQRHEKKSAEPEIREALDALLRALGRSGRKLSRDALSTADEMRPQLAGAAQQLQSRVAPLADGARRMLRVLAAPRQPSRFQFFHQRRKPAVVSSGALGLVVLAAVVTWLARNADR